MFIVTDIRVGDGLSVGGRHTDSPHGVGSFAPSHSDVYCYRHTCGGWVACWWPSHRQPSWGGWGTSPPLTLMFIVTDIRVGDGLSVGGRHTDSPHGVGGELHHLPL